jgi:hypothetical protein
MAKKRVALKKVVRGVRSSKRGTKVSRSSPDMSQKLFLLAVVTLLVLILTTSALSVLFHFEAKNVASSQVEAGTPYSAGTVSLQIGPPTFDSPQDVMGEETGENADVEVR